MITLRQIDAGLSLLGLRRVDLAEALGIPNSTMTNYFKGVARMPSGRMAEVQSYLENAGIEFTDYEGVRFNHSDIIKLEGQQGFITFMTDVMETSLKKPTEICVSNVDETLWENNLPQEFAEHYREQMKKAKDLRSKILIKSGDDFETASEFVEYRRIPEHLFSDEACFYAYGERLAIITFHDNDVQIVILNNKQFTDSFKVMFNTIWRNHEVLS